jgi:hypothetical protein
MAIDITVVQSGLTTNTDATQYYARATDPSRDEHVVFACPNLSMANAKVAELRMSCYRDVIVSLDRPPEGEPSAR